MYMGQYKTFTVSDEAKRKLVVGEDPLYVVEMSAIDHPNVTEVEFYDFGNSLFRTDGELHGFIDTRSGMDGVEKTLERIVEIEERQGTGADLRFEPADGYEPVGPLPITVEREDVQ